MFPSSVTFLYSGRRFTFAQDLEAVMKGNLACDCTKSSLIRRYCDPSFPALKCGHQIEILSLVVLEPGLETAPSATIH